MASIIQLGPKSFRVQIRKQGHSVTKTFKTKTAAERFGLQTELAIEAGTFDAKRYKLTDVIDAFRQFRSKSSRPISTGSTEHTMLNHLDEGLGQFYVDALTPQRLITWAATRIDDGAGPVTIGMEVSKMGTVLLHGGSWLNHPFPEIVKTARPLLAASGLVSGSKARDRRPTADEFAQLLKTADPVMHDMILIAVLTAMRRGEIVRVRFDDIDTERRLLLIRDRKNPRQTKGNHMLLPLRHGDPLGDPLQILLRQPRVNELIFPQSPEWVSDTFRALCQKLKIEDLFFHDLRHEAASRLFEMGWSIPEAAMVTGHKKWEHLKRYTNLRPESLSSPSFAPHQGTQRSPGSRPSAGPDQQPLESETDPR
jgi:integrase